MFKASRLIVRFLSIFLKFLPKMALKVENEFSHGVKFSKYFRAGSIIPPKLPTVASMLGSPTHCMTLFSCYSIDTRGFFMILGLYRAC
jgi:hypothetical protein